MFCIIEKIPTSKMANLGNEIGHVTCLIIY